MKKQKINFKTYFKNSMFFKGEFYIKSSIIFLISIIFMIIFVLQNGFMFFEFYPYTQAFKGYDFQVHMIDVGNGDAIIIKFPNGETMMIDTGQEYYENKVSSYVQQYLWSENTDKLDYLILTHADSDHVGGASAILDKFKVKNVYRPKLYSKTEYLNIENDLGYKISDTEIYDEVIMKAYNKNCNMIFSEAGVSFQLGGARVEFLAPLYDSYTVSNNYSAVIIITYQTKKFLFVGDAETIVERSLIEKYGDYLKADVLKVGHHGSYTSSSAEFLYIVNPEYALLSCKSSEYYPHPETIENLNNVNAKMLNTGIRGSFALTVKNNQIIYANAQKPVNNLALIFTVFVLIIFIVWENPFKKVVPMINKIKND